MEPDDEGVVARDYRLDDSFERSYKRQRRRRDTVPSDRISCLPDCLLVSILSLLRTKDAVKTGTLSKRWHYLWTSVPVLDFFVESTIKETINNIVSRVDSILILHESPKLTKFRVWCRYDGNSYSSNVNLWLRFATRKNVERLDLILQPTFTDINSKVPYVLPQYLYDNSSMLYLRLGYCQMVPHQPINWKSLNGLWLLGIQMSDYLIRDISSGCPSIKILNLYSCSGFRRLEINSKSLISLVINGYLDSSGSALEILAPNIPLLQILGQFKQKIRVIDLSSLVSVKLDFHVSTDAAYVINQDYPDMLNELLLSLKHVKNLTMGSWCTQVLSVLEAKALLIPLSKCKCLTITTCLNQCNIPGISSLLKSSPDLHTLVFDMSSIDNKQVGLDDEFLSLYNFQRENNWTSTGMLTCLMTSVKIIKIIGFRGERLEIELVQYLLENARVLRKMLIVTNKANHGSRSKISDPLELLTVVTSLLTFPRSSSNAVILFS